MPSDTKTYWKVKWFYCHQWENYQRAVNSYKHQPQSGKAYYYLRKILAEQYNSRYNVEISGILNDVLDNDPEEKVIEILYFL